MNTREYNKFKNCDFYKARKFPCEKRKFQTFKFLSVFSRTDLELWYGKFIYEPCSVIQY